MEEYNKSCPDVKVEIFRSGTEEVVSKVLAEKEAGSVLADVLLVSDAATFESLKAKDILMSYESPELSEIDPSFYDAGSHLHRNKRSSAPVSRSIPM